MEKSRILVVDDDAKVSHLVAVILQRCGGYEVVEENRSFMAMKVAEELRPNLILLDVDMPGKGGGELAKEIGAHPKLSGVPVLFITSLVSPEEAGRRCVKRGAHYFLSKPVLPNLLIETVRDMLESGSPVATVA